MLGFVRVEDEECRRPESRPFWPETHRLARVSALLVRTPTLFAFQVMQIGSVVSLSTHEPIVGSDIGLRKWHD
jgi:hypothetical protein